MTRRLLLIGLAVVVVAGAVAAVVGPDHLRDAVRGTVLSIGIASITACVSMVVLYVRNPSPRMPVSYVLAIAGSWLLLGAGIAVEIIERWGEALTWRWAVALAAYLSGLWAFGVLASHSFAHRGDAR